MINERFIFLMEKYFDNDLNIEEKAEFDNLLESNVHLKEEFFEQKRIKEVLKKMKLKNPSKEVWDSYWMSIYNKVERGIAWVAVSIGALIFFAYVAFESVQAFISDTETPSLVKFGIGVFVFGILILLFSIVREKIFTSKRDNYKEIQR